MYSGRNTVGVFRSEESNHKGSDTDLYRSKQTLNLHLGAARNDAPQTPPPTNGDTMLAALIPAVTELASGYLANRKEKAVAKQKLAVAKIEAQVTKAGLIGQPLLHQLPHPWTGKVESDRLPFPDPRPPHPLNQFSEGVGVVKRS